MDYLRQYFNIQSCNALIINNTNRLYNKPKTTSIMRKIFLLISLLIVFTELWGQESIPFNKHNWNIATGHIDTIGGRYAFTGTAILRDTSFSEGIIEWDIWANGDRSYAGVIFRQQANKDGEEVYIRPHKANGLHADALQYTPIYHGVSCWQLFHGKGYTSAAKLPFNEWVHFSLRVSKNEATLTMHTEQPVIMRINKLELENTSGGIAVKSPANGSAFFSNFVIKPNNEEHFSKARIQHQPAPGIIRDWKITKAMSHNNTDRYKHYSEIDTVTWTSVETDRKGMVNLTQKVIRNRQQPGWVYAKTTITSETEELKKYQLGYSDYVTVFVNRKPVFSSTNAYTSRDPGFAGLIGYFDELFLPLNKGENEICLLIGEQFGGWGFMLRNGEAVRMATGVSRQWELKHKLNYPESVAYDAGQNLLYVTNFLDNTGGSISRVTLDGTINDLFWVKGLNRPTGITILDDTIFVVERGNLVLINKENGKIKSKIKLEKSSFPNDIVLANKRELYITDSNANKIFKIKNNKISLWMEGADLNRPNGIEYSNGFLYIGCSGDSKIRKIDVETKEVTEFAALPEGSILDGLQALEDGNFICSDFNGHLFFINNKGHISEIINTVSTGQNLADFKYINGANLLIVPGLYSNILSAYRLNEIEFD